MDEGHATLREGHVIDDVFQLDGEALVPAVYPQQLVPQLVLDLFDYIPNYLLEFTDHDGPATKVEGLLAC